MTRKTSDEGPPPFFSLDDLEALADALRGAADKLSSVVTALQRSNISGAYFPLSNLRNTLLPKVIKYTSDTSSLAEQEVAARAAGTTSERTKNVMRYHKIPEIEGVAPAPEVSTRKPKSRGK